MVNIICKHELRQEIYDWVVKETDKVSKDSGNGSWLDVGVGTFYLNPTIVDSGLEIECGEDDAEEIYYRRFPVFPDVWILGFFENMKKKYPEIEMSGTFGVLDKYATYYYGVKATANSTMVEFNSMYQCTVCGKLTDNPYEVDDEDNDYSECICSPECAGKLEINEENDEYDDEDEEEADNSWISGMAFVTTGLSEKDEEKVKEIVEENEGVIKSGISKKVNYLIYNPNYDHETVKMKKAKELIAGGLKIGLITTGDFFEKTGFISDDEDAFDDDSDDFDEEDE